MKLLPLILACLCLSGCATLSTHKNGDLGRFKRVYVEHLLTDNYHLDELIVAELKGLGYDAACGPSTMMPQTTEVVITYRQRSAWDFKSYVIEVSLEAKGNISGQVLATGRFYQPSIRAKSPPEIVHRIITPLFKRS